MDIRIQHLPRTTEDHASANHRSDEGMWFIQDDTTGEILAKLVYHTAGKNAISLDSTVVSDALRGKNIGKRLVNEAAAFARTENIKLVPVCPFVVALFDKLPEEYGDVRG